MVTFENASTPGRGTHTLVKRVVKRELGEPLPVTIGWIGTAKDGGFAYYEPETNDKIRLPVRSVSRSATTWRKCAGR